MFRVYIRGDGITMWSDGFYGDWYINPAINYIQIEKHFGRGYGYTQVIYMCVFVCISISSLMNVCIYMNV
jgi:hypothetical protein